MAQKTVTVGTAGTPASLDSNFGNTQDNFTELYGKTNASMSYSSGTLTVTLNDATTITTDILASAIPVADSVGYWEGITVEAIFAEIGAGLGSFVTTDTLSTLVAGSALTFTNDIDLTQANSLKIGPLAFEGSTEDAFETMFSVTDPTADRSISIGDYDTRIPASTSVNADGSIVGLTLSGSTAMGTTAIASGSSRVVTDTATGATSTSVMIACGNADPVALTGYAPTTNGGLFIEMWPSTDQVNFRIYNNTGAEITPSERTINWRVI